MSEPINLKPVHKRGLDCLESCLLSLSNFYNHQYEKALYNCFNFQYERSSSNRTLGAGFIRSYSIDANLETVYRLKSVPFDFSDPQKMLAFTRFNLDRQEPLILMTSAYYCNWLKQYKQTDRLRFVVLTAYHGDGVVVLDPLALGSCCFEMSYTDFLAGCKRLHLVSRSQEYKSDAEIVELIKSTISIQLKNNSFAQLLDAIWLTEQLDEDFNEYKFDQWFSRLDQFLGQYLPGSCHLFQECLTFIERRNCCHNFFHAESEELAALSDMWLMLRNLFLRSGLCATFPQDKPKLMDLVKKIETKHCAIAQSLSKKL